MQFYLALSLKTAAPDQVHLPTATASKISTLMVPIGVVATANRLSVTAALNRGRLLWCFGLTSVHVAAFLNQVLFFIPEHFYIVNFYLPVNYCATGQLLFLKNGNYVTQALDGTKTSQFFTIKMSPMVHCTRKLSAHTNSMYHAFIHSRHEANNIISNNTVTFVIDCHIYIHYSAYCIIRSII